MQRESSVVDLVEVLGWVDGGPVDGEEVSVDENAEVRGGGESLGLGEGLEALFELVGDDDLNGGDRH